MEDELNLSVGSRAVDTEKKAPRARQRRAPVKRKTKEEKAKGAEALQSDIPEKFSTEPFDAELSYSYRDETPTFQEEWRPSSAVVPLGATPLPPIETTGMQEQAGREEVKHRGNGNQRSHSSSRPPFEQRRDNRPPHQQRSRSNDSRQRFTKMVRIGQFSTGQMKELECFESIDKLNELAQNSIDFSKEELNFNEYSSKNAAQLLDDIGTFQCPLDDIDGRELNDIKRAPSSRIFEVFTNAIFADKQPIVARGVLESIEGGDGLIVYASDNYRIKSQSTFVSKLLVQKYGLRRGQEISAYLHPATQNSTCPFAIKIKDVMGRAAENVFNLPKFKDLLPYYPTERLFLETNENVPWSNHSMRIVDLLSPIGLGQRGLIVAPPRTGKTILLQGIANAISMNRPDVSLIILLIDERPEEVTDFRRQVPSAEIISSTFDESTDNHVHAADMVIDKARRKVEAGQHVVILLDSITRLARAHNTEQPSSGKLLSGGVDANALQAPKRFFGSARNIEGGGSLTILATALVETGSKMDEVIFEEFKGTGNMELHLDRSLVEKRMFPAISIEKSGTRKEELLYHPDELEKVYALRRAVKGLPIIESMELLIQRIRQTKTNTEFLLNISR
ncbi:MAG: transcription termination factor Rho [Puniceicoccales bacterium]|jgi:transcription termination factor Rho|nr:transcription termination factor Rho [Puniceicoccales bacterium]